MSLENNKDFISNIGTDIYKQSQKNYTGKHLNDNNIYQQAFKDLEK